jgi:excisionase family DNA binding protein
MNGNGFSLNLPPEVVEAIAERAAELVAECQTSAEADGFLDVEGAAAFLACSRSRIYTLVSARRIPVHRDGSRLLFDRSELRDFVRHGGARRP